MTFDEFSLRAQKAFRSIPAAYREGVEGVIAVERLELHPELTGIVTLGECRTHDYASDWQGPVTTRSQVVLYYGSFCRMAANDPEFDWEAELWETLTHELRHHLESLARDDALEAMDYAMDEAFKREQGEPFDPWYFQWGEPIGEGMYRMEDEIYIERVLRGEEFDRLDVIEFALGGESYRVARPEELGDVHYVVVEGIEPYVQLVLIRRASWRRRLGGALRSEGPVVLESWTEARRTPRGADGDGPPGTR